MKKKNIKNIVLLMCVTSFVIALSVLFKFISSQIKIFDGYGLDLEYVVLILGMIMLPKIKYRLFAMVFSCFLWMIVSPPYVINAIQVFVEYILVVLVYTPFLFINASKIDTKLKQFILIPFVMIVCTFTKLFVHVLAGVIWWVNGDWIKSLLINSKIVLSNMAINIALMIMLIRPCLEIKGLYFIEPIKRFTQVVYI